MGVRLAGAEDVAVVGALRRAWAEEQAGAEIDDPAFEEAFAVWSAAEAHQRVTWLAYAGDEPVGMLNLVVFTRMPKPGRSASGWGYVANVYVHEEHRDRGLGTELLDACLAYARDHGFVRVVLTPSKRAVPFYTRAGFAPATSMLVLPLAEL